jgi:penicillin-insensitive murein DD-endopeptidase
LTRDELSRLLFRLQKRLKPLAIPGTVFALGMVLAWGVSKKLSAPVNPWALVKTPIGDAMRARAIGGYSGGCLVGGVSLPPDGPGFQLMRLTRRRFYGHPNLVDFIRRLSDATHRQGLVTLLIGDLGQPRGGPTNSNHKSHQSGLDVDIWFWRAPDARKRSLTLDERESLSAPSYVSADGERVNAQWTTAETRILKAAANIDSVERIFVNAAIKKHICKTEPPRRREWLRKLRPWYGHDDHFHARLKCPTADCVTQEVIPPGDGCDATLDWWFSEEAKTKGGGDTDQPTTQPALNLPAECDQVLAGGPEQL